MLENLNFEPVTPKAKVVVNSRTGTVVIGGDVRISPAAVAHGSLSVKIQEDTKLLSEGTGTVVGQSATVSEQEQQQHKIHRSMLMNNQLELLYLIQVLSFKL